MTVLIRESRGRRPRGQCIEAAPSLREVCLLGVPARAATWTPGERLDWEGRAYRVAAVQGGADIVRYVHLAPASA
jgi:hypothetical protein